MKLRERVGIKLLRRRNFDLYRHYHDAAERQRAAGKSREAEHCDYICIGIIYAAGRSRP